MKFYSFCCNIQFSAKIGEEGGGVVMQMHESISYPQDTGLWNLMTSYFSDWWSGSIEVLEEINRKLLWKYHNEELTFHDI